MFKQSDAKQTLLSGTYTEKIALAQYLLKEGFMSEKLTNEDLGMLMLSWTNRTNAANEKRYLSEEEWEIEMKVKGIRPELLKEDNNYTEKELEENLERMENTPFHRLVGYVLHEWETDINRRIINN